ncbi:MAG: DUF433 domain-containing protein [Desulfococcaceae bacterium]
MSLPTIVRTGRGLTIAGTRITLYQIMDFLKADCSVEEILTCFRLTIRQMTDVLKYIETHQKEVESEYQKVLALAESNRLYWEERNRERFERISRIQPKPEYAELWKKLQVWKTQLSPTG